jgi:RecA-family ATPase
VSVARDFDDVLRDEGQEAVRAALDSAHWSGQDFAPVEDVEAAAAEEEPPLPGCADPSLWTGKQAPHRRFIVPGWVVRGAAGLLSGQEGVGKSLLAQMLATCVAVGIPFLGLEVTHVNALYLTCEDPMDELWRRQEAINKSLGLPMDRLAGSLLLASLAGEIGNEFGTFDQQGRLTPSMRYRQVRAKAIEFGANLVLVDNAAHVFPGNENARHDVAAFLGLIERLSIDIDGAVVLLAHPNKQHAQGNKQGNEYSGSTGWSAHVRNRLFLDWAEEDGEGNPLGGDGRVLRKSKANYGKRGEEITFRWHEWSFVTDKQLGPSSAAQLAATTQASVENELFLRCLDKATKEKRATSASRAASNYAPKVFAQMPLAKGYGADALERAFQRLLHLEVVAGDQRLWKRDNRAWQLGVGRL